MITGIGGQGVQLAAQALAQGAALEGREVMLFGVYGGAMRGMNTDATVVVGDGPLRSPPLLSRTWSAVAMHDRYWAPVESKIRDGGVVVVNPATFTAPLDEARMRVFRVAATEIAAELGNELGASMVMLGAYLAITGLVGIDAGVEGMRASLPPYRREHIAANDAAIRAGAERADRGVAPAWARAEVPA